MDKIIKVCYKGINDMNEFNNILEDAYLYRTPIFRAKDWKNGELTCDYIFVDDSEALIRVEFKDINRKTKKYIFDKDGMYISKTTPLNAMCQMAKVYRVEKVNEILGIDPESIIAEKPLLYANDKFRGKPTVAYEYDLSSAYLQMLKLPLPITSTMKRWAKLDKGQIGFYEDEFGLRLTEEEGEYCDYVFDAMESPYKDWADKQLKKIMEEKDELKKTDIKNVYRYAVGCLRHTNPFWRGTILGRCNNLIRSLWDENTIYANTDSIVSSVPRPDIMDSGFIWKLKHNGEQFKLSKRTKYDYQWELETPTQRGLVKRYVEYYNQTHEEPWDILKDTIPGDMETLYIFNKEKFRMEENTRWLK